MARSTRARSGSLNVRDLEKQKGDGQKWYDNTAVAAKSNSNSHDKRKKEHPLVRVRKEAVASIGERQQLQQDREAAERAVAPKRNRGKENAAGSNAPAGQRKAQPKKQQQQQEKESDQKLPPAQQPAAEDSAPRRQSSGASQQQPHAKAGKKRSSQAVPAADQAMAKASKRPRNSDKQPAQQQDPGPSGGDAVPVRGMPGVMQRLSDRQALPTVTAPSSSRGDRAGPSSRDGLDKAGGETAAGPSGERDDAERQAGPSERDRRSELRQAAAAPLPEVDDDVGHLPQATVTYDEYRKLLALHRELRSRYEELQKSRIDDLEGLFEEQRAHEEGHMAAAERLVNTWRQEAERQGQLAQQAGTADLAEERDEALELNLSLKAALVEKEAEAAENAAGKLRWQQRALAAEQELQRMRGRQYACAEAQTDAVQVASAAVQAPSTAQRCRSAPRTLREELMPEGLEADLGPLPPDGRKAAYVPVSTPAPPRHAPHAAPSPLGAGPQRRDGGAEQGGQGSQEEEGEVMPEARLGLPQADLQQQQQQRPAVLPSAGSLTAGLLAAGSPAAAAVWGQGQEGSGAARAEPDVVPVVGSTSELHNRELRFTPLAADVADAAVATGSGSPPAAAPEQQAQQQQAHEDVQQHAQQQQGVEDMSLTGMDGEAAQQARPPLKSLAFTPRRSRAINMLLGIEVESMSGDGGAVVFVHRPSGFKYELRQDQLQTRAPGAVVAAEGAAVGDSPAEGVGDDGDGVPHLTYRPLDLGGAAGCLPAYLHGEIMFEPAQREEFVRKVMDALKTWNRGVLK